MFPDQWQWCAAHREAFEDARTTGDDHARVVHPSQKLVAQRKCGIRRNLLDAVEQPDDERPSALSREIESVSVADEVGDRFPDIGRAVGFPVEIVERHEDRQHRRKNPGGTRFRIGQPPHQLAEE